LICSLPVPLLCLFVALRYAIAIIINFTDVEIWILLALGHCLFIPFGLFLMALRHALVVGINISEDEFCLGIALI
jgi:hypothetical protein